MTRLSLTLPALLGLALAGCQPDAEADLAPPDGLGSYAAVILSQG